MGESINGAAVGFVNGSMWLSRPLVKDLTTLFSDETVVLGAFNEDWSYDRSRKRRIEQEWARLATLDYLSNGPEYAFKMSIVTTGDDFKETASYCYLAETSVLTEEFTRACGKKLPATALTVVDSLLETHGARVSIERALANLANFNHPGPPLVHAGIPKGSLSTLEGVETLADSSQPLQMGKNRPWKGAAEHKAKNLPPKKPKNVTQPPYEGAVDHDVYDPATGNRITDIDRIEEGVLWERKSAGGGMEPDPAAWAERHLFGEDGKIEKYIMARRQLPGYENAPVGLDFTDPVTPEFRSAIEAAVDVLREQYPNVEIRIRWR
ncbi:hypothetical protein [Corallococcus sp. EGB]|uniref:hypothetical protein n=1 Tax=Corallococcus sp. EGB TaxID=1521117 RepID=UPI001CBEFC5D|nr:hypothetical protein [Corallococcus sp. EGB]